uniref:Uncharacterized protein n=1 Tax=Anas platyrhynchos platyrhynchos TaxID=8840 RepID=A0A493TUN1_ANAPP
ELKKQGVRVHPEGKFVVDVDKNIDINDVTPNCRVALRNDSYTLHKILPNKVDPLVSLMMVEKVPDSTYEMIGGLDKQIKEIKEVIELPVKHPELFEALGIAQPKTLLARAVAHHTDCTFIRVSGSELVQKFIGEGKLVTLPPSSSWTRSTPSAPPAWRAALVGTLDGFEATKNIKVRGC